MRPDGRAPDELRPIIIHPNYIRYPEGSVLIQMGNTHVLCNVTIEERVPTWLEGTGSGWITAEYALLPRSTHSRTPREYHGPGGRTQEIRRLIGRSLRAAINLEALGERQCIVDCDVLQADGGTRTAAITGGYVALVLALRRLIQQGEITSEVFRTPVAAVSVGIVDHEPRLDLCYEEDSQAEVDLNVVMTGEGSFVEIQGTAEKIPFSRQTLDILLDMAARGIEQILASQQQILNNTLV